MVAGISGYAVAGGLELALLCDLRVMEDTAIMGLYGRRFGKCSYCGTVSLFIKLCDKANMVHTMSNISNLIVNFRIHTYFLF